MHLFKRLSRRAAISTVLASIATLGLLSGIAADRNRTTGVVYSEQLYNTDGVLGDKF